MMLMILINYLQLEILQKVETLLEFKYNILHILEKQEIIFNLLYHKIKTSI